jgi:hypothetical protein
VPPGYASPVAPPGPKSPLAGDPALASNSGPGLPAFAEIPVSFADQNVGGVGAPGAASGAVGLAAGGGNAFAPNGRSAFTGRPGTATGSGPGQASSSSAPGNADTAAALRAAGESCGEESTGDTGLGAVEQKKTEDASDQKKASCAPAADTTQAATGSPASTAPAGSSATSPAAPIGNNQQ